MQWFRPTEAPQRPARRARSSSAPEVLVAVEDPALAEQVRQVVAAAGRACLEAPPRVDRRLWRESGVVVMDEATARRCVAERRERDGETALVFAAPPRPEGWQLAVSAKAGHVLVLPQQERELVRAVGEAAERRVGTGRAVAVLGARGGAGASTLAAALALVCARFGRRTLAVDLDQFGGGLDMVLGIEREPGLRWRDLSLSGGRVSASALHEALPGRGGRLAVLAAGGAGPGGAGAEPVETAQIETEAALAVLDSARSAGDTVVVDLPRGWGDLQQAVLETVDAAVLVVPAELRAMAAARSLAPGLARLCANTGVVARGPSPGGLRLARAAEETGLPLLAAVHHEHPVAVSAERGGLVLRSRSSLLRAAESVLVGSLASLDLARGARR